MRFQVPQFIEVEDKIFGPFTLKQFVYLAGGAGIVVVSFTFLPNLIAILVSTPFVILSLALAFYKINNKPFINILEAFFTYSTKSKLYIWKKEQKQAVSSGNQFTPHAEVVVPRLSNSKLKDLSWSLDVKQASHSNINNENLDS